MDDLISRNGLHMKVADMEREVMQKLLETPQKLYDGSLNPMYMYYQGKLLSLTNCKDMVYDEPSAQPTLYGYPLEHLAFIARVMEREGVTPEAVAKMLDDVGGVVRLILEEIHRQAENAFEDWRAKDD